MEAATQEPGDVMLHLTLQALLNETQLPLLPDTTSSVQYGDCSDSWNHVQRDAAYSSSPSISAGNSVADRSRDKLHPDQHNQIERSKRQRKDRISTYSLRKSEKLSLELELQLLNAQVTTLKSDQQVRGPRTTKRGASQLHDSALEGTNQARNETDRLRNAVQSQQLSFARVQSAFSVAVTAQNHVPFGARIRLGSDWDERHATLLAMKDDKIRSAQRYIAERSQFLDRSVALVESSRFVSPTGDLCALRFDVIPFEGVYSVHQVFEALLYYGLNMEISISEVLGDITIREDDGVRQQGGILQNRFVSSVRDDIQIETNTIIVCQLHEAIEEFGGGREFAVLVADFVDDDELFPYQSTTRLRHDVTAAVTVTLEPRKTVNERGEVQEELVAVMTRTSLLRLHRTDLPIPPHVMQELRVRVEGWGDAMIKIIRGILYPEASLLTNIYAPPLPVSQRLLET